MWFEEKSLKYLYFIVAVIPCNNFEGDYKVDKSESFKIISYSLRNNKIRF